VLVYVTEELDRRTHVKTEGRAPLGERMYVLKLNRLLRFATGIYDYAVMTTVFSVPEPHLGHSPFQAVRVVGTTQEWCGQVFQRIDLEASEQSSGSTEWQCRLRSYFEGEEDRDDRLAADGTGVEDNLWIWIRELDGPVLASGETVEISLVPSLWQLRKEHTPPSLRATTITKGRAESFAAPLGERSAVPWTWTIAERTVTAWVEDGGSRRLLGWDVSDGGSGRLVSSERIAYWQLHDEDDLPWRERMGLPSPQTAPPSPR
jgi:hypothetical protein